MPHNKLISTSRVTWMQFNLLRIKACLICLVFFTSFSALSQNIIYMIGDGMGPNYLTAYRYWLQKNPNKQIDQTIFDELWTGMAKTHPDDNTFITDSASAATALNTQVKSYNGAISVTADQTPLTTILEKSKKLNYTNAIVVTSQITHATPAAFYAHQELRKQYPQIADQIVDNKINNQPILDLMLGGGIKDLIRDDRNILAELQQLGYQTQADYAKLDQLNKLPAAGIYFDKGFPSAIDEYPNRLADMTEKALSLLASTNKFFLMVESSQIDWCGHSNDIACALAEMNDFAKAIKIAKHYVDTHPDTQLVITADHETGGLSIGSDGVYKWQTQYIDQTKSSIRVASKALFSAKSLAKTWSKYFQFELEETNLQALTKLQKAGDEKQFKQKLTQYINEKSFTGWTSGGHTAADVPILSYGKHSQLFSGFMDNTEIAKKLDSLLR
ncbi:alkaline phosphatase [Catenovulum maritimum]|uniref:alkaline phosphatase n=1 Tax=Catenovulum maritimum TaxID=1513271 RepID=UPI001FE10040|nr:alkaline phosphatase [Catenovulum maritimum]